MKNIAGIFYDRIHANQALADLLDEGFSKDDISIIMSDKAKERLFHGDNNNEQIAEGGAAGATIGGVFGGILAGLTAIGSITIPGAGLLAAGPIIAVLTGVGAGATVGGLAGALINAGISAAEAHRYEDEVKKGNFVLVVRTDNEDEMLAAHEVMRRHDAVTESV